MKNVLILWPWLYCFIGDSQKFVYRKSDSGKPYYSLEIDSTLSAVENWHNIEKKMPTESISILETRLVKMVIRKI